MYDFTYGYHMGGMHLVGWLLWIVVVVVLVWVLRAARTDHPPDRESPQETLRRRLARGEITPEEYERTKLLLDRDASR